MLVVKNLTHRFGDKTVLKDINLEVSRGEIMAIMGTSGGGKTTLLRCIAGLLIPSEGEITIDGVSMIQNPEEARRKIGMVFQSAALFDYLNVRENIAFGVRRRKRLKANEIDQLVQKNLELVSLGDVATQMPSELSGGMQKRVGLARALAVEPEIILYDEPTSGLDPVTAYSIDRLIVSTQEQVGVTSLVVSHDVSSVFRVADRIAFLEGGELTFVGSTHDFREEPTPGIADLLFKFQAKSFDETPA